MKALLRPLSWLPRPFGERAGVMGRTGHILTARALTPTLSRGNGIRFRSSKKDWFLGDSISD